MQCRNGLGGKVWQILIFLLKKVATSLEVREEGEERGGRLRKCYGAYVDLMQMIPASSIKL